MRWVQVTPGVTLKSYIFFKPLDLSRSNNKKKTLINANILIRILLIIPHLLYFISISKPKKSVIFDSLSLSLSLSLYVSLSMSFSSTIVLPPWIDYQQKVVKQWSLILANHKFKKEIYMMNGLFNTNQQ